jgi:hypothetical protein
MLWIVGLALDAIAIRVEVGEPFAKEVLIDFPIVGVAGIVLVRGYEVVVPNAREGVDVPVR